MGERFFLAPALAAVAIAGSLSAGDAEAFSDVRRCEDANGRITYSNESCPTGTTRERAVEDRPAVEVPRDPAAKPARPGSLSNSVPLLSGKETESVNPDRAQEISREQRKSQIARCDDLTHRIEFGQQDLLAASPGERASVELGLRRLQEEYKANCAPR
jgi:hypothetical protein